MSVKITNPHIQTLLTLAEEDESTLRFPLPDQIYGFHAQQSVEKLMKALIAAHGQRYAITHSLEKLRDMLEDCGEPLPDTEYDLLDLEPFAVKFRYDIGGSLSDEEKAGILNSMRVLREFVVSRILDIESAGTNLPK